MGGKKFNNVSRGIWVSETTMLIHNRGIDFDDEEYGFQEESKSEIKVGAINIPFSKMVLL